jgi:hypothetical protein
LSESFGDHPTTTCSSHWSSPFCEADWTAFGSSNAVSLEEFGGNHGIVIEPSANPTVVNGVARAFTVVAGQHYVVDLEADRLLASGDTYEARLRLGIVWEWRDTSDRLLDSVTDYHVLEGRHAYSEHRLAPVGAVKLVARVTVDDKNIQDAATAAVFHDFYIVGGDNVDYAGQECPPLTCPLCDLSCPEGTTRVDWCVLILDYPRCSVDAGCYCVDDSDLTSPSEFRTAWDLAQF